MSKRDDSQRVSVVLNTQLHPHNTEITPQHCDSRRLQSMQLLNRVQVNGSRKASTPLLCPHRGHTNAAFGLLIPMRFISMWQGIVWKACYFHLLRFLASCSYTRRVILWLTPDSLEGPHYHCESFHFAYSFTSGIYVSQWPWRQKTKECMMSHSSFRLPIPPCQFPDLKPHSGGCYSIGSHILFLDSRVDTQNRGEKALNQIVVANTQ